MIKSYYKKIVVFSFWIIALLMLAILYVHFSSKYNLGIPCMFYKISGLYCSGCGLTRAAGAMLRLDFYQAFKYNALSVILFPLLLIFIVITIWEHVFDKSSFISKIPISVWGFTLSIVCIYGVIRNFIPELQPIEL